MDTKPKLRVTKPKPMTAEDIEQARLMGVSAELCELALDGLRFRVWCEAASPHGSDSVIRMARLLANATTPMMYREAIDRFIVERAKR